MIVAITDYLTILAAYSLLLTCLIIVIRTPNSPSKRAVLFFILCVILYLIIDYFPPGVLFYLIISGPFLIPFSFWLVSRSLFSDRPLPRLHVLAYGTGVLIFYYGLLYLSENDTCQCTHITDLLSHSASLVLVILAIFEAQRGKNIDLVEQRKKLRTIFTYSISILVLVTLLAELGLQNTELEAPKLLQRTAILSFNLYFLIKNLSWKDTFLNSVSIKTEISDPELFDQIQLKMSTEKLYLKEGLTIGQLAEALNEQQYKVRQAINQQMGYRNFTDFVNSYRIQQAKQILSDANQRKVTVLEVAYQVGFNSISPFNRAFKLATGVTPTEFRKRAH